MNIESQVNDKLKLGAAANGRTQRARIRVCRVETTIVASFGTYRNLPTVRPFANDKPEASNHDLNRLWYELSPEITICPVNGRYLACSST